VWTKINGRGDLDLLNLKWRKTRRGGACGTRKVRLSEYPSAGEEKGKVVMSHGRKGRNMRRRNGKAPNISNLAAKK